MGLVAALLCAAFSFGPNGQAPADTVAAGSVRVAAADSTKPLLLPPVVVSAKRIPRPGDVAWIPSSARHLYADDGSKLLLADLRITSPLPASADLRLHGLPVDETARDYIWGHRIGGPTTAVLGTRTKINPDVLDVALHPFLMSHQFRDTNGSLELRPAFHSDLPQALSVSTDAIERRMTLSGGRGSDDGPAQVQVVTSLRQSDVVSPLKSAVPELRAVPRYLDSQTHALFRSGNNTLEAFALFGAERGDWRDTADSLEAAILEDTRQNLGIVRWQQELPHDSKLTAGVSWEADHVDSEHRYGVFTDGTHAVSHLLNPRVVYSTRRDAYTVWASEFLVESAPGASHWRNSMDAGMEAKGTLGWLTVQPSIAVQQLLSAATLLHGVTMTAHPGRLTASAGYGTYADYFVFRNGIFGNVFDPGGARQPQRAVHYVASAQYEPERRRPFDLVRITALRKDMQVDLWGARNDIRVLSWDCIVAKGGPRGWEVACLTNDARNSDGPLVGLIPFSLRSGFSCDLRRSLNVSVEANYRSGSIAEYRVPGPLQGQRFKLDPSHYLNVAVTQRFAILNRPASLTATVFNALALTGSRAEITVDQFGRRYDAPCWANIRLRYDYW